MPGSIHDLSVAVRNGVVWLILTADGNDHSNLVEARQLVPKDPRG